MPIGSRIPAFYTANRHRRGFINKRLSDFDLGFVIYKLSDVSSSAETNVFAVEFKRHPRDLGVVVIVLAEGRMDAVKQAWRLYPEYKRDAVSGRVYAIQYAEIDWENGRAFIMRRKTRPTIPKLIRRPVAGQGEAEEEEND